MGFFEIYDDEQLASVGICSRIEGEMQIQGVSTLQPLGCLREVDGILAIVQTSVTSLSGLAALEYVGGLGVAANPQLPSIGIPTLQTAGDFYITDHAALVSLDLPSLEAVLGSMEILGNPRACS